MLCEQMHDDTALPSSIRAVVMRRLVYLSHDRKSIEMGSSTNTQQHKESCPLFLRLSCKTGNGNAWIDEPMT